MQASSAVKATPPSGILKSKWMVVSILTVEIGKVEVHLVDEGWIVSAVRVEGYISIYLPPSHADRSLNIIPGGLTCQKEDAIEGFPKSASIFPFKLTIINSCVQRDRRALTFTHWPIA